VNEDVSIADEITTGAPSATRLRHRPGGRRRKSEDMPATCDF
jgi:hypothetical protein